MFTVASAPVVVPHEIILPPIFKTSILTGHVLEPTWSITAFTPLLLVCFKTLVETSDLVLSITKSAPNFFARSDFFLSEVTVMILSPFALASKIAAEPTPLFAPQIRTVSPFLHLDRSNIFQAVRYDMLREDASASVNQLGFFTIFLLGTCISSAYPPWYSLNPPMIENETLGASLSTAG